MKFSGKNSNKGATRVTQRAMATSARMTQAGGSARGLFRRAFATRGASSDAKGSGARSHRPSGRLRTSLAVFALALLALVVTAAPALAAPLATTTPEISAVSYTSAHVKAKITSPGCGFFCATSYSFQYSKDPGSEGWSTGPSGGFEEAADGKEISGDLEGLQAGTKYFVRLTAAVGAEEATSPGPNPDFTTLLANPPTIPGVVAASQVFSLSATATGKVVRPASSDDVKCRFEYIGDDQYKANELASAPLFEGAISVDCAQSPIKQADAGVEKDVTAPLAGLEPATTYHLRLIAENAAASSPVIKVGSTFTTAPKVAEPKVLTINNATDVSYRSAKVSGSVERPAGADPALDTSCRFEYITDAQFTANVGNSEPGFTGAAAAKCDKDPVKSSDPTPTAVKANLTGLKSGATYHLRLAAENAGGTATKEAASTFTTIPGGEPSLTIDPNPIPGSTKVRLTGTAARGLGFSKDSDLVVVYEYAEAGTESFCCGDGYYEYLPPGPGPKSLSFDVPNLNPDTEYEFRARLVERDPSGEVEITSLKPNPTATTGPPLAAPTATIDPVTTFTATTAHFSGTVDTHAPAGPLNVVEKEGYKVDWHFECTPECKDVNGKPVGGTVEAEEGSKVISADAVRLSPNAYYEVKLVAHNEAQSVETAVQTFQTPLILADVKSFPGAPDGQSGYTLEGLVNSNNSKLSSCRFEYGTTATYPNTYQSACLPSPSGSDEVQKVSVDATEGQFKLSFRGQTTADIAYNASPATVATALKALSSIGASGVSVSGAPGTYDVKFAGPQLAGSNIEPLKGSDGTIPLGGGGGLAISAVTEGGRSGAVTVEARLEGLTAGATYHFRIFATNAAGTASTPDRIFIPTLDPKGPGCANEQLRKENNSLALPECRAYEIVTPPVGKEGFDATFSSFDGGESVAYGSGAGNIAKSGQNLLGNVYVTTRTATGWKTIPNLNGSSGTFRDAPSNIDGTLGGWVAYSADFRSSIWRTHRIGDPLPLNYYLRAPDGTFTMIGSLNSTVGFPTRTSADLSHLVVEPYVDGSSNNQPTQWGPGVYEFIGTGVDVPRRVDLDNLGNPVSECDIYRGSGAPIHAVGKAISKDGRIIVSAIGGGCGGANPSSNQLWARVNGTTSFNVSASLCNRTVGDPGGICNGPVGDGVCTNTFSEGGEPSFRGEAGPGCRGAQFQGAAKDGSRVIFTTKQQLVNGDTDQTNDIYACDLPAGNPAPTADKANPCAAFNQVSGAQTGADVENVLATSNNGATVLFTAKGVLADNEDALGKTALGGDHNLYIWRTDGAHPAGQTTFVGRLDVILRPNGANELNAQSTPDGRYLVFTTANQLLDTDTDEARDVYRYDAGAGQLTRVSTNAFGVGGNGEGFDADGGSVSDDGQKIVFGTSEALAAADGNGTGDVYLWTPGRVSLITTGAVGGGGGSAVISASGQDIYFQSGALIPVDGDGLGDVYDARIGGGFSYAEAEPCSGEACQPSSSPSPSTSPTVTNGPNGEGNVKPKVCPKGKVVKGNKCVKKPKKKHHKKKGKGHGKRASHNRGGSK